MDNREAIQQSILSELEMKFSGLEEAYNTRMQSLYDTCLSKNNNADKFANCIYDSSEKFKKEQTLLEHKLGYMSYSLGKCL
jgi:hypothetical protein